MKAFLAASEREISIGDGINLWIITGSLPNSDSSRNSNPNDNIEHADTSVVERTSWGKSSVVESTQETGETESSNTNFSFAILSSKFKIRSAGSISDPNRVLYVERRFYPLSRH